MTDTPHTDQLRDRIAAALEHEDVNWGYNCGFSADLLRDDRTAAFVSAVLAVVQPELDRARAEQRSGCPDPIECDHEAEAGQLRAELAERVSLRDARVNLQMFRHAISGTATQITDLIHAIGRANGPLAGAQREAAWYRRRWESTVVEARRQAARADELERQAVNSAWNTMRLGGDRNRLRTENARLTAELEQLRAELARVNDALRAAGIEHPLGAQGVRDLAAMANGRAEELATGRERPAANRSAPGSAGERIEAIAFDLATGSRVVPPDELHAAIAAHRDESRAAALREAAAMLRKYCPTHGAEDTCLMDCHCAGADEIDRDARKIAAPAPTPQSAACPCRAPGQDGDGRVRYQARDGEFVNLPCRSHVDVPTT